MTVIESLREWFKQYEGLSGRLDVDFLPAEADTYSLDTIPCEEVMKRYMDGGTLRQYQFAVSSRRAYDHNISQNVDNLGFFEGLTEWVEARVKARELPDMGEGKTARKLVVTSNAYPFVVTEDGKARYQIQMRLEYYKEAIK